MPAGSRVPAGFRISPGRQREVVVKKATANSILIHAFGACSCLLAVTVPGTAQQAEFPVDADGFRQLRIAPGLSKGATVLDVLAPFMEHFPGGGEGRPRMTLTIERIHGNVRFDLTETGFWRQLRRRRTTSRNDHQVRERLGNDRTWHPSDLRAGKSVGGGTLPLN